MSRYFVKKSSVLLGFLLASAGVWAQPYASKTTLPPEPAKTEAKEKEVSIVSQPDENQKHATAKKTRHADWDLPVQLDPDVRIAKVYEFLNDPEKTKGGHNAALSYEFKYFNYGAITEAQKKTKMGHYYVVSWENGGSPANVTLRFDYRQAKTQDLVHTLEIPFKNADGFYKANFSVVGDAYAARGAIKSWRIAVVRNGAIVAKEQSYIW